MSSDYVNPRVVAAQYAVRGLIPLRAQQIREEIQSGQAGDKYPFTQMIFSNIGNPQALKQKPLTFHRQVMALFDAPMLLDNPNIVREFPTDAVARAQSILQSIDYKTGAYTDSQGFEFARRDVANFIDARDAELFTKCGIPEKDFVKSDIKNIFLTNGASTGVGFCLQALIGGNTDGVMLPIPQYPLYSASITLLDGASVPYQLDEENGWALNVKDLEESYEEAAKKGVTPRVLVVINPGNPTGQVLSKEVVEGVLKFAHSKKLLVMADEVYQDNIYGAGKEFCSFRGVALTMDAPYKNEVMVASLHSTSKGVIGECGRRGGFCEFINVPETLRSAIVKLASISLCSNVNGQVMTALMVNPPQPGDASYDSYTAEWNGLLESLKKRALHLVKELNGIPGYTCNETEGAMYAFPQLNLPAKFVEYNKEQNEKNSTSISPDARYCLELLESTGIVVVPGSGFGQKDGTFHFRTTILPPQDQMEYLTTALKSFHLEVVEKYGN